MQYERRGTQAIRGDAVEMCTGMGRPEVHI